MHVELCYLVSIAKASEFLML